MEPGSRRHSPGTRRARRGACCRRSGKDISFVHAPGERRLEQDPRVVDPQRTWSAYLSGCGAEARRQRLLWTAWLTRSHGGADPQAPRLEIEQGEAVLQPQPDVRSTGDDARGHDAWAAQVEPRPPFRDWFDHDDTQIRRHPETIANHGELGE